MTAFLLFLTVFASLALAAFCAGAETAFTSVSRGRVVHMAREGSRAAGLVHGFLQDAGRTLTSLLVGNNLAHVVFSSSAAALGTLLCDETYAISIWTAASAFAILYLGEFVPKLLCSTRPLSRSLSLAGAFEVFSSLTSEGSPAMALATGWAAASPALIHSSSDLSPFSMLTRSSLRPGEGVVLKASSSFR